MSHTQVLPVDRDRLQSARSLRSLAVAAAILRDGGTVAFPTETVYGLGAHAMNAAAVGKIFEAKQRPGWDPLIVHIAARQSDRLAGSEMLSLVATALSAADRMLMDAFWPGPLTLLLPKQPAVPSIVSAGRKLVGVRAPAHPVARALLELAGIPVAAPSANTFGRISPTAASHVLEDLDGRIDAILDGGSTTLGLESTVLDANTQPPVLYRHGMVTIEQIRWHLPSVIAYVERAGRSQEMQDTLPSPGVGLRHYAPRASLVLVEAEDFAAAVQAAELGGEVTGVLLPLEFSQPAAAHLRIFSWGRWSQPEELAERLFQGLRELDRMGVTRILCPLPSTEGVGSALRDRLSKAAKPAD